MRRISTSQLLALVGLAVVSHFTSVEGFQPPLSSHHITSRSTVKALTTSVPRKSCFGQPCRPTLVQRSSSTELSAGLLTSVASSPLGAITLLAVIVLIHEAGHYLAARIFGIAVEEFSVGIGPRLFGFKAFGDEFNLRALPLGGYVRFPENYNATLVEEMRIQAREEAKAERERKKNGDVKTKLLNILTLGAMERKRKQAAALAEEEKKPFWQRFGSGDKDEIDVPEIEIPYDDNPRLLQNRPWQERVVVLSGGVIFNLLLSFSIYFGLISFGPGIPSPVFEPGIVVSSAPRPQAAAEGLLREGDIILDINGSPLTQSASPTAFESRRAINNFIATIQSTPPGEDIKLTVLRDNKPTDVVRIKPKATGRSAAPTIGVLLTPNFVKSAVLQSKDPITAARMAAQYTSTLTKETATDLLSVITSAFSKSSSSPGPQVSGPIGLIKTGSDIVATQNFGVVLLFVAALSINLGVINALPLPALDGGQLVFVLAEALTGRKVDQRLQEGITGVAVFFLLLISLGAAVGDLSNIFVAR